MNANDSLPDRLRALLADDPRIAETRMFGGFGFMLNGNMAVGLSKKGELIVRLDKDSEAAARKLPHAAGLDFGHRMGSMLFVPGQAIGDDDDLRQWVDLGLGSAATLPAK